MNVLLLRPKLGKLLGTLFALLTSFFTCPVPGTAQAELLRLAVSTTTPILGHPFERYAGGHVKSSVFDGLTQITISGQLKPALALSWQAETNTRWVFKLRPGVLFHNGNPFSAESVVEIFEYLKLPDAERFYMAQELSSISSARALDTLTVEINTTKPDPLLPRRMSILRIIDMSAWLEKGEAEFTLSPVGTGPFVVSSWGENATQIKLNAFDSSWRRSQHYTNIQMDVVLDSTRRMQALLSGEVDIAVNLDPDGVEILESAGYKTITTPNPIVVGIGLRNINADESPLMDKRVRQALNHAVNKEAIVKYIHLGQMSVASQGVTPGVFGFNPSIEPYSYDVALARKLLAESGYPDGFSIVIGAAVGQVPGDSLLYQQVAQDLRGVGLKVELRSLSFPEFSRRIRSGDWDDIDAFTATWSSRNHFDALPALESHSCKRTPTPFFCDQRIMQDLEAVQYEIDASKREKMLMDIMAETVDQAPSIFLVNYSDIVGMRSDIMGYELRSDGIPLEKIWLAN